MHILFVHGMGRSPLSGWPMLYRFRRAGHRTDTFGYVAAVESFETIKRRLISRIARLAAGEAYAVVGHSLGGVLIRAALNSLPENFARPRHVFLLGSPIHSPRLAVRLKDNVLFRVLAGDCGQLLASPSRMGQIGSLPERTTNIAGVRGLGHRKGPFGDEPNDGVVALSEVSAAWLTDQKQLPVIHTFLPASGRVAEEIIRAIETGAD